MEQISKAVVGDPPILAGTPGKAGREIVAPGAIAGLGFHKNCV
jgi:hypothetical protein